MILITCPFIGRLFDKKGHAIIILPGSVAIVIGLFALSQAQSAVMLVVASLLCGLGYGAPVVVNLGGESLSG
jgi:MFS family permease